MTDRLIRLLYLAPAWIAFAAGPAHAYIAEDRWSFTATNGSTGSQGAPVTLTWSFAPDGTTIPSATSSNLISFLDTTFGAGPGGDELTARPWFPRFEQSFDRLSELSGVTYIYQPNDDGQSFSGNASAAGNANRGDVRLGGKSYGSGSNILASNFFPDYGDMMINTDQESFFINSGNNYRAFRNTLMHEAMHGLGIDHVESSSSRFLIEPTLSTSFDGPQLDDILAIQRLYGDALEKTGGNDTSSVATQLGTLSTGQTLQRGTFGDSTVVASTAVDFLSIDDNTDTDFFSFTLGATLDVSLTLTPKGATYQVGPQGGTQSSFNSKTLSNLSLALFDSNGTTQLGSTADLNGAGGGESILRQLDPGTYFARVRGAQNDIQLYNISISGSSVGATSLLWVGNLSNVWNVNATQNFSDGGNPSAFQNGNHVTFNSSAATTTVTLPGAVAPGDVSVDTAASYVFSGPGGITAGSLTIQGGGTVELANSGNSYLGATTIQSGTLKITGNANAMVTPINVANGATLVMDATDAAAMNSAITISSGGVMEVGAESTSANVLSDGLPAIVNDGLIRVLDSERLRNVSGAGQIVIENETAELAANSFTGVVTVMSGGVAEALDSDALGSSAGGAVVSEGGEALINASGQFDDAFQLQGNGSGAGALRVASGQIAMFTGEITATGAGAAIRVDADGSGTFDGAINAADDATLTISVGAAADWQAFGPLTVGSAGLVKSGPGTAVVGSVAILEGPTRVDEGELRVVGSGTLTGEFRVETGAILETGGGHAFTPTSRLKGGGKVEGSLTMPGTIAPGASAGLMWFSNDLTLTETSVLEIELGGTASGIDYDVLSVDGAAMLDGILEVALIDGFVPDFGNSFTILTASQALGVFTGVNLPELDAGLMWEFSYLDDQLLLEVSSSVMFEPADFNQDGLVDEADLAAWQGGFGTTGVAIHSQGDADGDLNVDGTDFLAWQRQQNPMTPLGSAGGAVPEPDAVFTAILALAGYAPLVRRQAR